MKKKLLITAGVAGLLILEISSISCSAAPPPPPDPQVGKLTQGPRGNPPQSPDVHILDHRPQGSYLRGRKLDDYLYFFGTVDAGTVKPTDEKNQPLDAGKLAHGLEDGKLGDPKLSLTYEATTMPDPCIRDTADASIATVPTYELDDTTGSNICGASGSGREDEYDPTADDRIKCHDPADGGALNHNSMVYRAIAVPGYWDANGIHHMKNRDGKDVFTMGCINSVIAKCVHWGYVPWGKDRVPMGATTGVPLARYHEACVYAARADYKGIGQSRTCGSTDIDIYDNIGIQNIKSQAELTDFEAGWRAPDPATPDAGPLACVRQTRYSACAKSDAIQVDAKCGTYCVPGQPWTNGILLCDTSRQDQNLNTDAGSCPGLVGQEPTKVCQ
jgi:hypothetical protein